ncbi:hypothetical protein NC651_021350 [Populus alba x Populus x berolinensis]|nr:hypothetical protein NC651_021350 [Populus alba x Populus x berolinensis]
MRIWVEWAVGGLRAVEVCCYRWGCCWRGLTGERDCRFSWQGTKGLLVWRLGWRERVWVVGVVVVSG